MFFLNKIDVHCTWWTLPGNLYKSPHAIWVGRWYNSKKPFNMITVLLRLLLQYNSRKFLVSDKISYGFTCTITTKRMRIVSFIEAYLGKVKMKLDSPSSWWCARIHMRGTKQFERFGTISILTQISSDHMKLLCKNSHWTSFVGWAWEACEFFVTQDIQEKSSFIFTLPR